MPKKPKNDAIIFDEQIVQKPMEDVMHESMIPYSEYVILERAIPRVEDGLKPVQRRILYTMNELGNTNDKPHRKCARIVGDCLGKYHPHGDTSVYDALARMAQPFVMRELLVDGHGNFGSIDGDSPAAMRYTEARMTPQAQELLRDIDKDTVGFHLNFDDSLQEPDVLPARFPNLLVNGASGIAVGLATNIPTHNLAECIDGAIALMENPGMTAEEMEKYIPAPDFPTGGIICRDEELKQALATGRGKIRIRAKLHIEEASGGKKAIVITEIPYQINKASMLEKILRLTEEKKALFSGISDIRDESDRTGMRAVIELRKEANLPKILNGLYKYSDLQTTFGVNMVAIAGGKPVLMGTLKMLGFFIDHQKNVITRRTRYELRQAEARAHILQGLIIAVDNLDEVIRIIRSSKNPKEARERLMQAFKLTEVQAQAILDMRLQRLTNLEVVALKREYEELLKTIKRLRGILTDPKKLIAVIRTELLEIRDKYADKRRTQIADEFELFETEDEEEPAEEAVVLMNRDSFLKRIPLRQADKIADAPDTWRFVIKTTLDKKLFFITDRGTCYQVNVSSVPECRLRDRGMPIGGVLNGIETGEKVLVITDTIPEKSRYLFVTSSGACKRLESDELNIRAKSYKIIPLKDTDRLVCALEPSEEDELLMFTSSGMAIDMPVSDIPVQGRGAGGVKGITLSAGDSVVNAFCKRKGTTVLLVTERGYMKKCPLTEFEKQARGGKGVRIYPFLKNGANGSCIAAAIQTEVSTSFRVIMNSGVTQDFTIDMVRAENKAGRGQPYVLAVLDDIVTEVEKL